MNKIKMLLMKKKPTLNDLAQPKMPKNAKIVFLASLEDAKREQDRILKQAKSLK